jgi:hypothetical protein
MDDHGITFLRGSSRLRGRSLFALCLGSLEGFSVEMKRCLAVGARYQTGGLADWNDWDEEQREIRPRFHFLKFPIRATLRAFLNHLDTIFYRGLFIFDSKYNDL